MDQTVPIAGEIDCPWFDPTWLLDHPDFPLAVSVGEQITNEEE